MSHACQTGWAWMQREGQLLLGRYCLLDPGLATDELGYRDGPRRGLFRPVKWVVMSPIGPQKLGEFKWALGPIKRINKK